MRAQFIKEEAALHEEMKRAKHERETELAKLDRMEQRARQEARGGKLLGR